MEKKIKLVLYDDSYYDRLEDMAKTCSMEVFGYGDVDIETFVNYHSHIYLAIISGKVVGFLSMMVNSYFGMKHETVCVTYIYIEAEYRRSKSLHLMLIQAGLVARDLDMPLEFSVASDATEMLSRRWKEDWSYVTKSYSVDMVNEYVDGFKNKIRIK